MIPTISMNLIAPVMIPARTGSDNNSTVPSSLLWIGPWRQNAAWCAPPNTLKGHCAIERKVCATVLGIG